jgi:hypothetical protein
MKKELNKTKGVFAKKSKMSLAKSTTALTCLVGVLLISAESANSLSTATGSFAVASSVAATCTISAASMTFGAYLSANTITATSVVTANCSSGQIYNISFLTEPDNPTGGIYYLENETPLGSAGDNRLNVTFTNGTAQMTNGAATISNTGTGTTATPGTITGTIASGQSGKVAGTYSKTMTLNIIY